MHPVHRQVAEMGVYTSLALYFVWPVLATGSALGLEDWDPLLFQHAAVLRSTYEYLQPPFWNPWYCGGNVLWQNPQAPLLTPVYVFAPWTGLALAMKIGIALHYVAGFAGMHLLLRRGFRVESFAWRFFLAGTFTMAGGVALHLSIGHATFLPYFYLPWVLWLFLEAADTGSLKHAAGAAAVFALVILNGGIYVAVMCAVALGVFAMTASACRRDWRPLAMLALVGGLAGLFAAPKLLPVVLFATDPRRIDIRYIPPAPDLMSFRMLQSSLLEPFQHRRMILGEQNYGWAEYGNYLGPFGIFVIAAAVLRVLTDRPSDASRWLGVSLGVTAVVLLLVAIGEYGPFAPYSILRRLPVLEDLRVPSRYLLVFTLFGTATVAWLAGGRGDPVRGRTRLPPVVAIALVLATLFLGYRSRLLLDGAFPYAPLHGTLRFRAGGEAPSIDATTDGWAPDSPMLRGLMANRGVLRCNEPLQLPGRVDPSRPILFSSPEATISHVRFSPNRIEFDVLTREAPARVTMNQKYAPGWRSNAGRLEIDEASGLAYVELPPYTAGRYAFTFRPPGLNAGLAMCLSGVLLAAGVRRRRL